MSTSTTSTPSTIPFPPEVLVFARANGIEPLLESVAAMTCRLFPTGRVEVAYTPDPELRDVGWVVFEVHVSSQDVPDFLTAQHAWTDGYRAMLEGPDMCLMTLSLFTSDP